MASIPAPPAGFTIDGPPATNAIPAPPAGFTLDEPQQGAANTDASMARGVTGQPSGDQSTTMDMLKSAGSGMAQGAMDLVGLPGMIGDAFNNHLSAALGMKQLPPSQFSGSSIRQTASDLTNGATEYKPKTTGGRYAQTAGSFVPGAVLLGGSGGAMENALQFGIIPGVASEGAGQLAQKYYPSAEPVARLAAAILAPTAVNSVRAMMPKAAAAKNLAEALSASGTDAGDVQAALANNPRLSPMDVNTNLQQMGMNLTTQGGTPRAILNDAVNARMAEAPGAVSSVLDQALGSTPNVKTYLDSLTQNAKENGGAAIEKAVTSANPVDVSPVLAHIDNQVSPGVNDVISQGANIPQGPVEQALSIVRSKLADANGNQLTDPSRLHQIQSQLRTTAQALGSSADGYQRLTAHALNDVRQKLIDQIDEAAGGAYRPAQRMYADDMAIKDAFDKGRTIFSNGNGASDAALENRPEYWADWVKNASQPEIDAAKLGARVTADTTMNGVRTAAAKGAALPDVANNQERLAILLGEPEAQQLSQQMADQRAIAETNARLFAGSQTAPRAAVNNLTAVTPVNPSAGIGHGVAGMILGHELGGIPGMAAGAALGGVKTLGQAVLNSRDKLRNAIMARAISGDAQGFMDAINSGQARLADPRFAGLAAALLGRSTGQLQIQPKP